MTDRNPILLDTKLNRPPITSGLINRRRLIEWLNRDIGCPLTLVCAPAGFGKTTLVCNWLEQLAAAQGENAISLPYAWLSLDENDSDITLFLHYVIAALRTVYGDAGVETLSLLNSRQQPPPEILHTTFRNELEKLPGEVILVLDDYQLIRGQDVHNLLFEMARHWPKKLYLVLISRIDPPLPLTSLRAKGMTREIRTQDLRFTPQEAAAYLKALLAPLDQTALQVLEERFEGWPAGLHLAALSLRAVDSPEKVLSTLSSHNPNITGYLVDEVLTQQLPEVHAFLLQTSILDRFCESLCAAVTGEVETTWNARACLDWIERAELFIIPLDDRREWYRYHHLFQKMLQQRLSAEIAPEQVAELQRRASVWFAGENLRDEAIHHALSAGDVDLAARQMVAGLRDVLNREDRPTLERWLRLLPEELIQQRPDLLMIRAWALQFQWRLDQQAQVLQQVEALLDSGAGASLPADEQQILRGLVLMPRAQYAYFNNQITQAIDLCRQALALFPSSWTFVRGGAMLFLGMSLQADGREREAEQMLLDEYTSYGDKIDAYSLFLLFSLCFNYLDSGRFEQAGRMSQFLIQRADFGEMALMKLWGDWFLGVVNYQWNDLEAAVKHFTRIVENRYAAQITAYRDAMAGLALIRQFQGESVAAREIVESLSQFDLEQRGSEDNRTRSLRARLKLLQGDLEEATHWLNTMTDPPPDRALKWLEEPQVTRARILVARGAAIDLQSARQILDALVENAGRTHNTRYLIEVLAIRAVALDALGKPGEAENDLKQAVELAQSGGFIRVFADLGQPMQAMLRRLAGQDHFTETIQRILAAFPEGDRGKNGRETVVSRPALVNLTLVEPLTPRELEVLALLQEPLGIKEIALQLNITHATARRHTINIYGKLGVNKRWDAVAHAIELGILSP